ncbi:MmcQ/YjbR family DNA-binding protein [Spirosoma sp. HMF3257]|uniref:MmcQ/YjbR family DNA-binding protein n=1 Tax=Spirosoma telluris TaxID=2183553 RepID=A0A327NNN3_9BACT|nr:MmcQ/YjbR family DNA-binding protein [Spirosoma telluris]RAI74238.1 MmcQ/YjbR family DNA-binding protein [Spirosoma telluris]
MVNVNTFRQMALSFPEMSEQPHFDKSSFKVGKKIVVTLNIKENRCCVKLSEIDQGLFSAFDRTVIYPVPNKWGKQGWTLVSLEKVNEETLLDALRAAYCEVAPKKLAALVRPDYDDQF